MNQVLRSSLGLEGSYATIVLSFPAKKTVESCAFVVRSAAKKCLHQWRQFNERKSMCVGSLASKVWRCVQWWFTMQLAKEMNFCLSIRLTLETLIDDSGCSSYSFFWVGLLYDFFSIKNCLKLFSFQIVFWTF